MHLLVTSQLRQGTISIHASRNHLNCSDGYEQLVESPSGYDTSMSQVTCRFFERNEHVCSKDTCGRVILNVSGLQFETQMRTLNSLPETLLGNYEKRKRFWDPTRNEYFFDRHRPSFAAILFFYQSGGRLVRPCEVPPDVFLGELKFFEMGSSVINEYLQTEGLETITKENHPVPKGLLRMRIWKILNDTKSSQTAKVFAVTSILLIIMSTACFCIETLPRYRQINCVKITSIDSAGQLKTKSVLSFDHPLIIIESVLICWFAMELFLRFLVCPSKSNFWKSLSSWIDIMAILLYFLHLFIYAITGECDGKRGSIHVIRMLRVTRVFKLSNHSEGLRTLAKTFKASMNELITFLLFFGIAIIFSSCAVYYAEQIAGSKQFTSIPDSFWWAVVSMTTVGYGDTYPETIMGKIVGIMTVLSGIVVIAIPVPVIATKFNDLYKAKTSKCRFYDCHVARDI